MDKIDSKGHKIANIAAPLFESFAKLLWPVLAIIVLFHLLGPISNFVEITLNNGQNDGKIKVKIAGLEVELISAVKQENAVSAELFKEVKRLNKRVNELEKTNNLSSAPHSIFRVRNDKLEQNYITPLALDSMPLLDWDYSQKQSAVIPNLSLYNSQKPLISGSIKSLLWVEDTPEKSAIIIKTLKGTGIKVKVVLTTEDALEELLDDSYSLVITDGGRYEPLVGGEKNKKAGLELIKQIDENEIKTPVVMFTSHSALKEEAFILGAIAVTSSQNDLLTMIVSNECRKACK